MLNMACIKRRLRCAKTEVNLLTNEPKPAPVGALLYSATWRLVREFMKTSVTGLLCLALGPVRMLDSSYALIKPLLTHKVLTE